MKLEEGLLGKISQTQRPLYIWSEKQKDHKHRDVDQHSVRRERGRQADVQNKQV